MIEIPFQRLGDDILQAIIEEFILREGTDYGAHEADFDTKVAQVHKQLASGDIVITFDPKTENCTLLTRLQFQRNKRTLMQEKSFVTKDVDTYQDYIDDMGGFE
ncbi:MAG: YheU family protein [Porticoccaceae bacterium]